MRLGKIRMRWCQTFISAGADLNLVNKNGETPLYHAVQSGSFKIVKRIIDENKVDLNVRVNGNSMLHYAMKRVTKLGIFERKTDSSAASLLLEKGAIDDNIETLNKRITIYDNKTRSIRRVTQLMYAIYNEDLKTAKKLLQGISDKAGTDEKKKKMLDKLDGEKINTALSYAKYKKLNHIVQLLRSKGASDAVEANIKDFMGICSIKTASKKGWNIAMDFADELDKSTYSLLRLIGAGLKFTDRHYMDPDKYSNNSKSSGLLTATSDCVVSGFNVLNKGMKQLLGSESKGTNENKGSGEIGEDQASSGETYGRHQISNARYFSQEDPAWAESIYSNTDMNDSSQKMKNSGCGPTAMAMVLSTVLGENITPDVMAGQAVSSGYRTNKKGTDKGFYGYIAKKYDIEEEETDDLKKVKSALQDENHIVIASVGAGHFTDNGHLIVLTGITKEDGQERFIVHDPAKNNPNYKDDGAIKKTDVNGIVSAKVNVVHSEKSKTSPAYFIFKQGKVLVKNTVVLEVCGSNIDGAVLIDDRIYAPINDVITKLNGKIISIGKPEGVEVQFEGENKSVLLTEFSDNTRSKVKIRHLMDVYGKIITEFDEKSQKATIRKLTPEEALIILAIRGVGIDDPNNWFFNLLKNRPIISDFGTGNNESDIKLLNSIYAKLGLDVSEKDKTYSAKSIAYTQAIIEYVNIYKNKTISKTGINGIDAVIWPNAIQEIMIEYANLDNSRRLDLKGELTKLYNDELIKLAIRGLYIDDPNNWFFNLLKNRPIISDSGEGSLTHARVRVCQGTVPCHLNISPLSLHFRPFP